MKKYQKVKVKFEWETSYLDDNGVKNVERHSEVRDYLQFSAFIGDSQRRVLYRAPDTESGIASLNRRNPKYEASDES